MTLTADQVAERADKIGGSDAASVVGLPGARLTARELYHVFRGDMKRPEPDPIDIFIGHQMEPMLVDWSNQRPERRDWKPLRDYRVTKKNRRYPFAVAHPDRLWPGQRVGWEGKTRHHSKGWGPDGTDEVPEEVALQCMHYMELFNYDAWDVAVFFFIDREFRFYPLTRDKAAGADLMSMEAAFMERVKAGQPPEWQMDHPTTWELMKRIYPGTDGSSTELPHIAMALWDAREDLQAQRREYDRAITGINTRLMSLMKTHSIGYLPDHSQLVQKRYDGGAVRFQRKFYD